MTPPMLELARITKAFPGVKALDEVRLEFYSGELTTLVGENGAGKSKLVKIMIGVYQPDADEIRLDGKLLVLRQSDDHRMDRLPQEEVMQRWWAAMAELMATNPNHSPVTMPLRAERHSTLRTTKESGAPSATPASRKVAGWSESTSSVVRVITGMASRESATAPARPEKPLKGATSTW